MDYAQRCGATINLVPVSSDMGYDLDEIEKRISKKTKLVFFVIQIIQQEPCSQRKAK